MDSDTSLEGLDYFEINLLPVVTLGNLVSIGLGASFKISLHPDKSFPTSTIFAFALGGAL